MNQAITAGGGSPATPLKGDHRGPDCRKRDTVLAAVKDAARRLQRWPDGRSGRKNGPGVEQKN